MTTISISVDEETKREMDRLAKEARKSRSDIVRELFVNHHMQQEWKSIQRVAQAKALKFELTSEEDAAKFLA